MPTWSCRCIRDDSKAYVLAAVNTIGGCWHVQALKCLQSLIAPASDSQPCMSGRAKR